MKITVKVFQGQETTLEVSGQTSVKELKHYVSQTLNVPVSQQKLLLTGKPLSDEKCLLDYPLIKDGTKINLVVKRTDEESVLRTAVVNFLRPRFSENDTQKIADEFMKVLYYADYERTFLSYLRKIFEETSRRPRPSLVRSDSSLQNSTEVCHH